jgi:aromatic ring-opening dioxygenase catalytic subunit (LigB family)
MYTPIPMFLTYKNDVSKRTIGETSDNYVKPAEAFIEWLREHLETTTPANSANTRKDLVEIMTKAPGAALQHPRVEHLIPLHVAYGAGFSKLNADPDASCKRIYTQMCLGSMSLDSYIFH